MLFGDIGDVGKRAGSQHFRKAQTRTSQPEVKRFSPSAARSAEAFLKMS